MRRCDASAFAALLVGAACVLGAVPAGATAAVFFPKGSSAFVARHDVTVGLTPRATITWDAVEISGSPSDVGVLVAVMSGGRVEVTGRAWADAIDQATAVTVDALPSGAPCNASTGDAGVSGSVQASGGCSGSASVQVDAGSSGCFSNTSGGGGGGCEPSDHGHPGCSALTTSSGGCGPLDNGTGGPGAGPGVGDASAGLLVGSYELVRVHAADGSAQRWIDSSGYDAPSSFGAAALALEQSGYDLFALHARSPESPSLVQSLRVVTTSPSTSFPLRLLRMGSAAADAGAGMPILLVVLADGPEDLAGQSVARVDPSQLAWTGSGSNYETLVASALDAGPWVAESTRAVSGAATGDGGAGASLGALFAWKCGDGGSETRVVCKTLTSGGEDAGVDVNEGDGGAPDSGDDAADSGDDSSADAAADAGTDASDDAGSTSDASDGSADAAGLDAGSAGDADCVDLPGTSCDDLDLAMPSGVAVASRFRGIVSGDPASIADLVFTASAQPLDDGRYWVSASGAPGTCEAPAGSVSGQAQASGTCKATPASGRVDFGPFGMIGAVVVALRVIMRRARVRR